MSQRQSERERGLSPIERAVLLHKRLPRLGLDLPVFPNRADRLLGVIEMMGASVAEFDAQGRMVYASPQMESISGFTPDEYLNSDCIEFHPDDVATVIASGIQVSESGKSVKNESRIRHKLGHWVWVETSLIGWVPSSGGGFNTVALTRDITELKAAEAARSDSEARYRAVSEMSCDLISESDGDGKPVYIGPGSDDILGYTREEMMAFEPFELLHPDDLEKVRTEFGEAYRADLDPGTGNRKLIPMEFRVRHRDGHWLWFETMGMPYERTDGEVHFLSVSRNVTQQKLAEQRRLDLELRMQRAQKLESLGVLAGGIAHDFNNILTPVLGEAGLGLQDLPPESPVRERFRKIQQSTRRAASLTNQMLAYAGQEPMRVERLDVSVLVEEMRDLVVSAISGRTTLDLQLEIGLPAIDAEAAQLGQVVLNLITNAAESLPDGDGKITLCTGDVNVGEPPHDALFAETMRPGRHVFFEVADTGCGMDAETSVRIFEPFYTTKFTGRGLGLAAVAGIVRGHHGAIEVDSQPGRGTRFRVLLPAIEGRIAPRVDRPPSKDDPVSATVLIIDDDEGVRQIAEDSLCRAGIRVLTASDGLAGQKVFEEHVDEISLVMLDRTMPVSSGVDTLRAICTVRPDAKILLISGYSEGRATEDLLDRNLAGFIHKPFEPETLLARVREVLKSD